MSDQINERLSAVTVLVPLPLELQQVLRQSSLSFPRDQECIVDGSNADHHCHVLLQYPRSNEVPRVL